MALTRSKWAKGKRQARVPAESGVVVTEVYEYTTTAEMADGDILEIGALPAFARVVDMILDAPDMDTGTPALAFDVGIMSGTFGDDDGTRTCGNEFFAADTSGQGGGISRMSKQAGFQVASTKADRGIGVKTETAAATWADGTIRLLVSYIQDPDY